MPKIDYPISGHKHNLIRPIAHRVIKDLLRLTKHSVFNVKDIVIIDEEGVRQQPKGFNTYGTSEVYVEVEDIPMDDTNHMYNKHAPEFYPVFYDRQSTTDITPYYAHSILRLSISCNFQSKDQARKWINEIKSNLRNSIPGFQHNLEYGVIIPRGMIYILQVIHQYTKDRNPDITDDCFTWMKPLFTSRMGTVASSTGTSRELAYNEIQYQVPGYFNFSNEPEEGEKGDSGTLWNISFDYELQYMAPIALSIHYPLAVSNQLLPNTLLGLDDEGMALQRDLHVDVPLERRQGNVSHEGLKHFSAIENMEIKKRYDGIMVPWYDEFFVEQKYSLTGTKRFIDMMFLLDPETNKKGFTIFNLRDLHPEVEMDKEVHEWMLTERPWLMTPGESLFQVILYEWSKMTLGQIGIDRDLNVRLLAPLEINVLYHIRIAIYYDWDYLSDAAKKRIPDNIRDKIIDHITEGEGNGGGDDGTDGKHGLLHMKTVQTTYSINYPAGTKLSDLSDKEKGV